MRRAVFRWQVPAFTVVAAATSLGGCGGSDSGPSQPSADLVTTVSGPSSISTSVPADFTVAVRNLGPDEATNVVASLDLLAGMTPVAGSPVTVSGTRASWPVLALLPAGDSASFTVSLAAASATSGTIKGLAVSDTRDPKPGNNDGSAAASRQVITVTVPPTSTDLRISFLAQPMGGNLDTVTTTLTIVNAGQLTATSVTVNLTIPDDIVATGLSPAGTRTSGHITWSLGDVPAGQTMPITLHLGIPLRSATALSVTASSPTPDPIATNNTAVTMLRAVVSPAYTLIGEGVGDNFGWVTEDVGDLNGDGKHDLAVTAPFNDAGGSNAGRGYVYSGATGQLLFMVTGDTPNGQLGYSVDVVGDLNGDGTPDLAFGAPSDGTLSGYALAVSGTDGTTLWRFTVAGIGSFTGYSVGRGGDLNADGVPDVLIGSPGRSPNGVASAGMVWVVSGTTGQAFGSILGTVAGGTLGTGVRSVGDLNNDGIADIAIGSLNESGGRIRVFSGDDGSLLLPVLSGPNGGSLGQYWVNSPGDLDGDGVADIFGVDINNGTGGANRGQTYVFSGADGSTLRTFTGESAGDQFGIGRGVGDITGDGVPDFALAAWLRSEGAATSGKMYLYDGATGLELRSLVSVVAGETLGFDLIGLGDVTGDGRTDYLITAGQNTGTGKAYLIKGVPLQ